MKKIDNTQEEICKIHEDKFEEQGLLTNTKLMLHILSYVMNNFMLGGYVVLRYVTLRYRVVLCYSSVPYVYLQFSASLIDRKDITEEVKSCLICRVNCKLTDCFSYLKEKR